MQLKQKYLIINVDTVIEEGDIPEYVVVPLNDEYINGLIRKQKSISQIPDLYKAAFVEKMPMIFVKSPEQGKFVPDEVVRIFQEAFCHDYIIVSGGQLTFENLTKWDMVVEMEQINTVFYAQTENPQMYYEGFVDGTTIFVQSSPVVLGRLPMHSKENMILSD